MFLSFLGNPYGTAFKVRVDLESDNLKKKGSKLNLGAGSDYRAGYENVDCKQPCDFVWDLEETPWPWLDDSVEEVLLKHALEHLGQTPQNYRKILRELYRVCSAEALVRIIFPHHRHSHFINDPTHVRPLTVEGFQLLSKKQNRLVIAQRKSNSTLGLDWDVDFEIDSYQFVPDSAWSFAHSHLSDEERTSQFKMDMKFMNDVVREVHIDLRVKK